VQKPVAPLAPAWGSVNAKKGTSKIGKWKISNNRFRIFVELYKRGQGKERERKENTMKLGPASKGAPRRKKGFLTFTNGGEKKGR